MITTIDRSLWATQMLLHRTLAHLHEISPAARWPAPLRHAPRVHTTIPLMTSWQGVSYGDPNQVWPMAHLPGRRRTSFGRARRIGWGGPLGLFLELKLSERSCGVWLLKDVIT